MPLPAIIPPLPQGPLLKKYILFGVVAVLVTFGLTFWIAYQTRESLIYQKTTIAAIIKEPEKLKDAKISLEGTFLPYSVIKKPLCTPIGKKQYPTLVDGYKESPALWGIYNGTDILAVKIVDAQGKEVDKVPDYSQGESLKLKGTLHLTTALDDCNLDLQYPSAYLEVTPSVAGL